MTEDIEGIGKVTFRKSGSEEPMPSGGVEHRMTADEYNLLQDAVMLFHRPLQVIGNGTGNGTPTPTPPPTSTPTPTPTPTPTTGGGGYGKPIRKGWPIILSMLKLPNGEFLAVVEDAAEEP